MQLDLDEGGEPWFATCGAMFLHFDVRRTMEWVDMWALLVALCLLRVHAVIRTDNLRVVWAVGSGETFLRQIQ